MGAFLSAPLRLFGGLYLFRGPPGSQVADVAAWAGRAAHEHFVSSLCSFSAGFGRPPWTQQDICMLLMSGL